MLAEHAAHGGAGDAMNPGDLAQAPSCLAIVNDSLAIEIERRPSDVPAFELGAPHAGRTGT